MSGLYRVLDGRGVPITPWAEARDIARLYAACSRLTTIFGADAFCIEERRVDAARAMLDEAVKANAGES